MPRPSFVVAAFALVYAVGFAVAAPWNSRNNPQIISNNYNYRFASLPDRGRISRLPWSDSYWPSFQGGIAYRWNARNSEDFRYQTYPLDRLRRLGQSTLRSLSPAEKYDIFMGRYDYPTVRSEWSRTSPQDEEWEGLCHGWAPASFFFEQPRPITVTNRDGIAIPFGSSDVKALLTYFVAEYSSATRRKRFVGERCRSQNSGDAACQDINAGAYHVIIANQIGLMNQVFLADRDRGTEVWNQPIVGYSTHLVGRQRTRDGSRVTVRTTMSYAQETAPRWEAHDPRIVSETYQYVVELDNNGRITGGDHVSNDRVDFAYMAEVGTFTGYFTDLERVYQLSIGSSGNRPRSAQLRAAEEESVAASAVALTARTGSFGTGSGLYSNNDLRSWSIRTAPSQAVVISFTDFATERHRDEVRIYEGSMGDGPLVAVFHGHILPPNITVQNSDGAFILFSSDEDGNDKGFSALYEIVGQ